MVDIVFDTNGLFIFSENAGVTGDPTVHAGTRTATLTDTNTSTPGDEPDYDTTFTYTPFPQILPGSIHVFLGSPTPLAITPGGTSGPVEIDFSVVDSQLDFLSQGEVRTQTIHFTVTDNNGGDSVTKDVQVQITGTNDKPVAHVDFRTINENVTTATTGVLGNDRDPDHLDSKHLVTSSVFSVTSVADPYLTKAMVKAINVNFLSNPAAAKDSIRLTLDKAFQGLALGENAH